MSSDGNGKLKLGGAALVATGAPPPPPLPPLWCCCRPAAPMQPNTVHTTGLYIAGSGSTLLSKSLYGVRAPRLADGRPKPFRKPLANTLFMFCGMALILPLMALVEWLQVQLQWWREEDYQQQQRGASTVPASDATQRGSSIDEPLLLAAAPPAGQQQQLAAADWLRQCGLLIVPTLLNVACTATHKIGGCWGCCCGLCEALPRRHSTLAVLQVWPSLARPCDLPLAG